MSKVFFSYRRKDSGSMTGRIIDRFKKELPFVDVFHDVESIPVGMDFMIYTKKKLAESTIFIPIIGNSWATSLKKNENDDNDYVRIEIEQALQSGIFIIPVFVEGAVCPTQKEIPKSISKLSQYNGLSVRPGTDFEHDIKKLISTVKKEIFNNATIKEKIGYKIKSINKKIALFSIASILLLAAFFNFLYSNENTEVCTEHKKAAIVAKFSENDDKGLSNTILTKLEKSLPDSIFNIRTSNYQDRNVDSYYSFIRNKYFDNKCDTIGLFLNGYYNEDNEIFNIYASNIGLKIFQPEYMNKKNIVLDTPKDITFKTKKDAEFLADFIIFILLSGSENNTENLKKSYEFQKKHNLTNKNQSQFGENSILPYVYVLRANNYAIAGNDVKANEYYNKAKKSGNTQIKALAIKNNMKVKEITHVMESNNELEVMRQSNIEKHHSIEETYGVTANQIEDFIHAVEKVDDVAKNLSNPDLKIKNVSATTISNNIEDALDEKINEKAEDVKTKLQEQLIKNNKKKEANDEKRRKKKEERRKRKE